MEIVREYIKKYWLWFLGFLIPVAFAGAVLDGPDALNVNERKSSQADVGSYAIGLLITKGDKMRNVGSLVTEGTVAVGSSTDRTRLVFSGEEVKIFVASTEALMPSVIGSLVVVVVAGSLTFPETRDDMESRLIKMMEENGISEYRIIYD